MGSAALIILLSTFNGFEELTLSLYNKFSAELRIEPTQGKVLDPNTPYLKRIKGDIRIDNYIEALEEKVLLRYENAQCIGLIKGVSGNYFKGKLADSVLWEGQLLLQKDQIPFALIGSDIQSRLSVNLKNNFENLEIYSPNKGPSNAFDPSTEFHIQSIHPMGIFQPQQHFDNLIMAPLEFTRDLLGEPQKVSAIELQIKKGISVNQMQKEIAQGLGEKFQVKNRAQQNELLYKILNSEKWAVFLILTFVLIIAIFNIIGSLTMLVIDKRQDIAILSSLGASKLLIRKIFFIEGMMIAMTGCLAGMILALFFCLLQQHYGWIKMGAENFLTDAYPVALKWTDFVLVFLTVTSISTLASLISSRLSIKHLADLRQDL